MMEKLLEDVSFDAGKHTGQHIVIDAVYVDQRLKADPDANALPTDKGLSLKPSLVHVARKK